MEPIYFVRARLQYKIAAFEFQYSHEATNFVNMLRDCGGPFITNYDELFNFCTAHEEELVMPIAYTFDLENDEIFKAERNEALRQNQLSRFVFMPY